MKGAAEDAQAGLFNSYPSTFCFSAPLGDDPRVLPTSPTNVTRQCPDLILVSGFYNLAMTLL